MGKSEITDSKATPQTIGISGANGFIGSHLSAFLSAQGHSIVPLPRSLFADGAEQELTRAVSGCDAIINLAGAPIDHRWTRYYKKTLWESRILTTRKLIAAIERSPRVKLLHSASAVGFYPSSDRMPGNIGQSSLPFSGLPGSNLGFGHPFRSGIHSEASGDRPSRDDTKQGSYEDKNEREEKPHRNPATNQSLTATNAESQDAHSCFDEDWATPGPGFLSQLCEAWEAEARRVNPRVRLVISRFGVVLDGSGGAFPLLALPARWKAAVTLGPGSQPFPWIDLQDLMRAVAFLMERPGLDGIFDFVAPGLITQRELSRLVARHYRSWFRITVPQWALKLLRGESSEFLTRGQCVLPTRLMHAGFTFRSPRIGDFLERL